MLRKMHSLVMENSTLTAAISYYVFVDHYILLLSNGSRPTWWWFFPCHELDL